MEFHIGSDSRIPYATLLLLGDPKAGKTLLASQMPHAFFFDIESGAHHTGCPRITFPREGGSYSSILSMIKHLAKERPHADGLLHWKPHGAPEEFKIGTLVIDTIDALQEIIKDGVSGSGYKKWEDILDKMKAVLSMARRCNCHIVYVGHSREYRPSEDDQKMYKAIPELGLSLQGRIRDEIPALTDAILHLVVEPSGTKKLLTQRQIINGKSYLAGDRYHAFGGKDYVIKFDKDGKVRDGLLENLLSKCAGGTRIDHMAALLTEAKAEVLKAAVRKRVLIGSKDVAGMDRLKMLLAENGMVSDDALEHKDAMLDVIENWDKNPEDK